MAAVTQVETKVTLDSLIARAIEVHGDTWQRVNPNAVQPFTLFYIGEPLHDQRVDFQLYDNKTVVVRNWDKVKRVFEPITPKDFWKKVNTYIKPAPVITPRPPVYNGLKTLHDLGRPFDWVDLYLTLGLAPAHAKQQLAELVMRKKVREVPVLAGKAKYEVVTANSPDLFPVCRALIVRPCVALVVVE